MDIEEVMERLEWSQDKVNKLLLRFIEEQGLLDELPDFFETIAELENEPDELEDLDELEESEGELDFGE